MEKIKEVASGDRVRVTSDKGFTAYLIGKEKAETLFVGPRKADLRASSFTVPDGYQEVVVKCDADSLTMVDIVPNRKAEMDPHSMLVTLESDQPRDIKDIIANQIAELLARRGEIDDPETIEEAYDFEMPEETWTEEGFEYLADDLEMAQIASNPVPDEPEPEVNESEPEPDEVVEK